MTQFGYAIGPDTRITFPAKTDDAIRAQRAWAFDGHHRPVAGGGAGLRARPTSLPRSTGS